MKELSSDELKNLTLPRAWEVAGEFAEFMETKKKPFDFEDELPYSKITLQIVILHILSYEDFDKVAKVTGQQVRELKEHLRASLMALNNFIPSEGQYARLLDIVRKSEDLMK